MYLIMTHAALASLVGLEYLPEETHYLIEELGNASLVADVIAG